MAKTRLLYLKSINDESTLRDIEYISRSKRFESFEVRVCFAMLMSTYKERDSYDVSFQELLKNLEEEILSFKPHKLLLHTGVAFRAKPASFLQALAVIKSNHPKLDIYYEKIKSKQLEEHPPYSAQISIEELLTDNDLFSGDEGRLLP
jgi:hypothetical protein